MKIDFEFPEGATPIDDISGLKLHWVKTQRDLNRVEAENILKAQSKYLMKTVNNPQTWFNINNLIKIHENMFHDVWDWAGKFRDTQTQIGIEPSIIINSLGILNEDVQYWCTHPCNLTFVEQAARIHHRLVFIHPFKNGNGRFSRLIADRYLKAWRCPFPNWPIELQNDGHMRKKYIHSLKSADIGDYDDLLDYMITLGAKDPAISEILGYKFYQQKLKGPRLLHLIKGCLKQGCPVNETINNGYHSLQLAAKYGLEEVLKLLIESGGDIHFRDTTGFTPFESAISQKQLSIAKILYDYGYPYVPRYPPPPILRQYYFNLQEFDRLYFN